MQLRPLTDAEIDRLSEDELAEYQEHLEAIWRDKGKRNFLDFCRMVEVPGAPTTEPEPDQYYTATLRPAAHHRLFIAAIQRLADGLVFRDAHGKSYHPDGIINMAPPGSAKSTYLSVAAPPWLMGRKPGTNVIAGSYAQELANRFGRRVRTVVRTAEFSAIMGCTITGDNQAVDNWSLTNGSDYRAAGIGAAVTGFRADWVLWDDPIKGREDADSEVIREKTWNSWVDDFRTRLKPGGKVALSITHWHEDDPAGRILGELWKGQSGIWIGTDDRVYWVINLPMIAEHRDDPLGRKPGEMLWPEHYDLNEVKKLENNSRKGGSNARLWSSLYQQRPAPAEGSILMRSNWRKWTKKGDRTGEVVPPECEFIFLSYDTAFEEEEMNDPSAMTAWGVFEHTSKKDTGEEYTHPHIIMLGAWEDWVQSADLADIIAGKKTANREDRIVGHCEIFQPHLVLVEKRASGHTVIQELKRRRVPVKAWLPRGKPGAKGKIPRAHGVAMMLEQGSVWYIDGPKTQKVIEQCAAFPNGAHDDLVDTVTCALTYARDHFMFRTADDEMDQEEWREWRTEKIAQNKPRRIYGESAVKHSIDDDDVTWNRMSDLTKSNVRKRLYGG